MEGLSYLRYPAPGSRVDFRYGRNTDWSPDSLMLGQCQEIKNLDITRIGRLTSRGGIRKINSTEMGLSRAVLDIYQYYKSDGTKEFLVHVDDDLYTLNLSTGASNAELSGLPIARPLRWLTFNDKAYGFGGDKIFKWDGTAASKLTSHANMPDLTCGAIHRDKLFGFAELSSNPSHLHYSPSIDDGSIESDWSATEFLRIRDNDGDVGKDVVGVSGGLLLALKSTSSWIIDGSEIYDFSKAMETDEIGLTGFTLAPYEGGAIWLSNQGVCYWNPRLSEQFHIISKHGCNEEILNNDKDILEATYGHFSPRTRCYYLSIHSSANAKVYVFYLDLKYTDEHGELRIPHSTYVYGFDVGPITTADGKDDKGELYLGNVDNGFVYEGNYGDQDEGSSINILFELADNDFGLDEVKKLRIIDQKAMSGNDLTLELVIDYYKKIISRTASYPNAGDKFDVGKFDVAKFGGRNMKTDVLKYTKAGGTTFRYKVFGDVTTKTEIEHPAFRFYPKSIMKTRES